MMVVDASVWVAAFLTRDVHREEVLAFLRRIMERGEAVSIPALALAEIGGAIARRSNAIDPANRAVAFIREQRWLEVVPIDGALADAAAGLAIAHRLRGADAVYAALAATRGVPLVTLDREMIDRAGGAFKSMLPVDWK